MTKNSKLEGIVFINLPSSMAKTINDFVIDTNISIPYQLAEGETEVNPEDITIERIVAAMIKIVAWDENNEYFDYYRDFIQAAQTDAVNQLNIAAIAKEKAKDYEFSEELFLAVNNLAPQPSTFINLATHYSNQAVIRKDKEETEYDYYLQKAFSILNDGLKQFENNSDLLCEIGYFHVYQNNIEAAREYLERYLDVAEKDDERVQQVKKLLKDINEKINDDSKLLEAYDQINMSNEDKAIELLDEFISKNPEVWNAHFFKGWALRRQEKFDLAKPCFLEALKLGECNSEIYNELAICALEEGQRELSLFYLDTAIDLDPESITLLTNYALLNLEDKNYDKARYVLEKARAIDDKDPLVIHLIKAYSEATGEDLTKIVNEEVVDDLKLKEDINEHDHNHDHENE